MRARQRTRLWLLASLSAVVILGAAVAMAVVPTSISRTVSGRASAANYIDIGSGNAAGLAVRRAPAGDGAVPNRRDDAMVAAIVADLTTFWASVLPAITGKPFVPLRGGLTAVDSSAASGSAPCVAAPADIVGNAYYCPSSDGIVYDATTLIPVVQHRYGVGGLITTFAHEFGHAVQARIDSAHAAGANKADAAAVTPLTTEARADCDAGTFLAWVMSGHGAHLHLDGSDGGVPLGVIGPLIDFSDPATVSPNDPTAHGLAIDRLTWFTTGYRDGADTCAGLGGPLVTALGRITAPRDGSADNDTPRYASRGLLLTAAERSIDAFSGRNSQGVPSAHQLDLVAPYGQFAQATAVALANSPQPGAPTTTDPVAAACFAGSWVRSVFGKVPARDLGGRPGDVDAGLSAVILQPDATFDSVAAYSDGFRSGRTAC